MMRSAYNTLDDKFNAFVEAQFRMKMKQDLTTKSAFADSDCMNYFSVYMYSITAYCVDHEAMIHYACMKMRQDSKRVY